MKILMTVIEIIAIVLVCFVLLVFIVRTIIYCVTMAKRKAKGESTADVLF